MVPTAALTASCVTTELFVGGNMIEQLGVPGSFTYRPVFCDDFQGIEGKPTNTSTIDFVYSYSLPESLPDFSAATCKHDPRVKDHQDCSQRVTQRVNDRFHVAKLVMGHFRFGLHELGHLPGGYT